MQRLGSAFHGFTLQATDGTIGEVTDMLFDDRTWRLRWLEVYSGAWMEGRRLLIHPTLLAAPDMRSGILAASITRQQAAASPEIDAGEPITVQMEQGLAAHYGCGLIVENAAQEAPIRGRSGVIRASFAKASARRNRGSLQEPHLRSLAELNGYAVEAADGDAGFMKDVVMCDETWRVCALVVETPKLWFGRPVMVPAEAAAQISWTDRCISLIMSCDQVKTSALLHPPGPAEIACQALLRAYRHWRPGPLHRVDG